MRGLDPRIQGQVSAVIEGDERGDEARLGSSPSLRAKRSNPLLRRQTCANLAAPLVRQRRKSLKHLLHDLFRELVGRLS